MGLPTDARRQALQQLLGLSAILLAEHVDPASDAVRSEHFIAQIAKTAECPTLSCPAIFALAARTLRAAAQEFRCRSEHIGVTG